MSTRIAKSRAPIRAVCPKCKSRDIKGPFDTENSAQFLFTRSYFCRVCWWDEEVGMEDDTAKAAAKAAKEAAQKAASDARMRRPA